MGFFPDFWSNVCFWLALRRHFLSDPEAMSHLTRRQQIMAVWTWPPRLFFSLSCDFDFVLFLP